MHPLTPFRLSDLRALVHRVPIAAPVRTSFGIMTSRPAVFVCATTDDGLQGWGEIWCNFPSVGAEHRANLLVSTVAPLLVGREFASPAAAFSFATESLEVLAIQSGEPGPLAQVIAGVDIALWDLAARRAGVPLYRMFTPREVNRVPVYASGLNPDRPEQLAAERLREGHRAFKLKVGFGRQRDLANLKAIREVISNDCLLMADANQAWDLAAAKAMARDMEPHRLEWLEEPLRADAPCSDWGQLAMASPTPLAAGENARGESEFTALIEGGAVRVLQPDLAKWGGFSGCVPVAERARGRGLRCCPHWLGGGIGLVASMHLLAAIGGDGMVEVDSNPNPLRTLIHPRLAMRDGVSELPPGAGLGATPDLAALHEYLVEL